MMKLLEKPVISERFDLDDIRKIREYNSLRHAEMTTAEVIEDIKKNGGEALAWARAHAKTII